MIRLVPPSHELLDAAEEWVMFKGALTAIRDALSAGKSDPRWGTRFFLAGDPPEAVGWGGFKGPPRDGVVEIGYEIAEAHRQRGFATAAALAMVAEAFADGEVTEVIAHTLPERNASNRVLEKTGFAFDGMATEDGQAVWRWTRPRIVEPTDAGQREGTHDRSHLEGGRPA